MWIDHLTSQTLHLHAQACRNYFDVVRCQQIAMRNAYLDILKIELNHFKKMILHLIRNSLLLAYTQSW